MDLRWDLMHRSPDGSCLLAVVVTDDESEDDAEHRYLIEVVYDEDGLSFCPVDDLSACYELYQGEEDPEALPAEDRRRWYVARLVDGFVGRLANSRLLDVLSADDMDDDEGDSDAGEGERDPAS